MFTKLFEKCKRKSSQLSSFDELQQSLDMLEEKENILQKKISIEIKRAKEFTKAKNSEAAMQCLKRKKFYENQIGYLGTYRLDKEHKIPQKPPLQIKINLKDS